VKRIALTIAAVLAIGAFIATSEAPAGVQGTGPRPDAGAGPSPHQSAPSARDHTGIDNTGDGYEDVAYRLVVDWLDDWFDDFSDGDDLDLDLVTAEPEGGSPMPTSDPVLAAEMT
jgi:hypothetical protein